MYQKITPVATTAKATAPIAIPAFAPALSGVGRAIGTGLGVDEALSVGEELVVVSAEEPQLPNALWQPVPQ